MRKGYYILILVALAALYIIAARSCVNNTQRAAIREVQAVEGFLNDSGKIWKNKYDQEHRLVLAREAQLATVNATAAGLLDTIANMRNMRKERIRTITILQSQLEGTKILLTRNYRDSTRRQTQTRFSYADKWLTFSGSGTIESDTLGPVTMGYQMRDSLIMVGSKKRIGFLKTGTLVDVWSANPEMHHSGIRSLLITERPKRFGIGPAIGITYINGQWQPTVSLSLQYDFISF